MVGRANPISEIDEIHYRIHDGLHFVASNISTGVNVASPKQFLLITPNTTTRVHFIYMIESGSSGIKVEIFETTVVTGNGSAITAVNNNRNSSNVAEFLVFQDPVVTSDGTLLHAEQAGTTTTGARVETSVSHLDEFVLNQNTKYEIKVTVLANGTDVSSHLHWYEVKA